MVLKKNLGALLFLFFWGAVFSQEKQLEKANEAFRNYAYIEAREMFLKAIEKGGNSIELYERLGDSYYFNGELEKAAQWYRVLSSLYPEKVKSEYRIRYAQCLKSAEGDEKEDDVTSQLYASHSDDQKEEEVYNLINDVSFKKEKSKKYIVDVLNINSKYSDYAPSFNNGELVFASSRNTRNFSAVVHEWNNQPFLDLYTTTKGTVKKQSVKKLKGDINSKFHESSATFSKDRKTVYFTRNNYSKRKSKTNTEGVVLLKIYRARYEKGKWGNVEELPFNSDEYSIAHPALSYDEKFLYFASDMPGTQGKSDLYVVAINEDKSFGIPKNLGSQINTSGRETFPYISDKGKLFFASDGHQGIGGLDIFMAMENKEGLVEVYNLGEPINSPKDDFTFIINEENKTGYFASNRSGGKGDDDIYGFRQLISFPEQYHSKPRIMKKLERIIELKPSKEGTTSL
ncbi:WD40 repeat protein [Aquimarina sp. MAR_2010_214]|uniref:tetratricopeptide repeat protein n=1 Tax=Aquimarina sp. MAR_2010_214 TaxID=1250026 RepID=UPI000C71471D|nr:tetratricopeptide repeat protein [Aquimarina sp. MAR_2010_214]PKV52188.1 WD40 repeat protein [Aquimarina sp. MAR_2010_214]